MNPNHHRKRAYQKGLAMHVVLKSNFQVFLGNRAKQSIDRILVKYSRHFGVKVYHRAILGDHLHLILLPRDEESLAGWLRVVAGQLSLRLWKHTQAFWKTRPWSRLIHWGRDYRTAQQYLALNYLEAVKAIVRSRNSAKDIKRYQNTIRHVLDRGLTQLPM